MEQTKIDNFKNIAQDSDFNPLYEHCENMSGENNNSRRIDIIEFLARTSANCLISKIIFEPISENDEMMKEFVDNINENNELEMLIRGQIFKMSKLGEMYLKFDLYEGNMYLIPEIPNVTNQCIRLYQQKPIAIEMSYIPYRTKQNTKLYIKELITPNYNQKIIMSSSGMKQINTDVFFFEMPEYVKYLSRYAETDLENNSGFPKEVHNYGVMCATQFLNQDKIYLNQPIWTFADAYPAIHLVSQINNLLNFMYDEPNLNFSRVFGNFDLQDLMSEIRNSPIRNIQEAFKQNENSKLINKNPLKSKMYAMTSGANSDITIQQSTFNGVSYNEYLVSLIRDFMTLSGYSYDMSGTETYQNSDSVQNVNKNMYETTKMKKRTYERVFYEHFGRMYYVWLTQVKKMSPEEANEYRKNINKYLRFELVSNMLNDYLNGIDRLKTLQEMGAIDHENIIRLANPDMNEDQILKVIDNVDTEKQEMLNVTESMIKNSDLETQEDIEDGKSTEEEEKPPYESKND